jgi:hypothetical protein
MAENILGRIEKDIRMFDDSVEKLKDVELSERETHVYELALSYAKDAMSWLSKKDYYTSFASISYAHGLMDALIKIKKGESD